MTQPAPDVLALLRDLVAIDSTTGSPGEAEVLRRVAAEFDGTRAHAAGPGGAGPEVVPEARVEWAHDPDGRATALLVAPAALPPGAPLLVFAAHADVVPATRASAWSSPPFTLTEVGDRLVGRGSSDMKSGLAAAVVAVRRLLRDGAAVALAVTTGEEVGCLGAPALVALLEGRAVGAVVVPESTAGEVVLGHRGALWLTVSTAGVAAHGSTPERGHNAVLDMVAVLGRLDGLPLRDHAELGRESVNVGVVSGGSVPNIVPDQCSVRVDHRVVSTDVSAIVAWWRSQPEVTDVTVDLDLGAVWTRRDHPWLAGLGAPVAERPAAYFTDASVLVRALPSDVPVVVWGPGDPTAVHSVDESVPTAAVHESVASFVAAGTAWARGDAAPGEPSHQADLDPTPTR
ncbi:M20 family metallopeptidase [Frigoribacterium endophyticum]|uniref:M20 family metallopeptidase n=1 Tax=Frigoribacterium endophyticum TaxID=1522176 RepID=UPI0014225DFF|nr:M20/M25/M40 family metallo-hydrolase [Frigoribacterium endophyticum]NII51433.1 succinyl-diaminopimelate desuccinylase [Frigoribacterium endophyticum]